MGFSLIGLLITGVILLPNLLMFLRPPINMSEKVGSPGALMTIIERLGQAACFLLPVFSQDFIKTADINLWFFAAALCVAFYYGLWLRYAVKRDFKLLFAPFLRIPIPMAVFPVLAFAFIAIWIQSIWLGVAALLLAVGHFTNSRAVCKSIT